MADKRFSFANTGLVRAEARHVRSSARKVRLVLEDIRGRSVIDARKQLLFSPRAVAKDIELVLRSAVTNAEVNHGLSPDDLVIHEAFANEGVTIKRFKPRARGRASKIRKRTAHITILLRSLSGGTVSSRCKVRSVTNSAQLTATLRTVSIARRPLRNAFLRTNPGMVMPEARCRRSDGDGVPWESAELMPQTHPFRGEGFGCHSWPPWDRG